MSQEPLPLVTVITPTYNQADTLAETIESVLSQDYPNIEYIVLDDGSTDHTREVLQRYVGRLKWESHANMGEARTTNKGWSMAQGEFVMALSSDDLILPGLIRKAVAFMQAQPDTLVVYPGYFMIDTHSTALEKVDAPPYDYLHMLGWHRCLPGVGSLIRRRAFDLESDKRDPAYRYVGDYEYWLRLGLRGPFALLPETLAAWRQHSGSTSVAHGSAAMAAEHVQVIEAFYARPDLPPEVKAIRRRAFASAYYIAAAICLPVAFFPACGYLLRALWCYPPVFVRHPQAGLHARSIVRGLLHYLPKSFATPILNRRRARRLKAGEEISLRNY